MFECVSDINHRAGGVCTCLFHPGFPFRHSLTTLHDQLHQDYRRQEQCVKSRILKQIWTKHIMLTILSEYLLLCSVKTSKIKSAVSLKYAIQMYNHYLQLCGSSYTLGHIRKLRISSYLEETYMGLVIPGRKPWRVTTMSWMSSPCPPASYLSEDANRSTSLSHDRAMTMSFKQHWVMFRW